MAKQLALCAVLLVITAAVKVAYLGERRGAPDLDHPVLDARIHHEWATALATGEWSHDLSELRDKPYFRAPLYPYFVAAVYRLTGAEPRHAVAVQIVLGCAIALDSLDVGANTNLADVLMREGDVQQAHRYLERALAVDPDFPNAILGMAYYYRATGQMLRAQEALDRLRDVTAAKKRER